MTDNRWFSHIATATKRRVPLLSFIVLVLVCPLSLHAQYDPAFNHYLNLQSFYNPAASGLNGQLNVQG